MCSVFRSDSRVNEGKKQGIFPLWSCLVLCFHKSLSRSRHFGFKTRLDGQPRVKSKMAAASYSSSGFECSSDDFCSLLLTFHTFSWGSRLLQHKLLEEQLSSRQNSIIFHWKVRGPYLEMLTHSPSIRWPGQRASNRHDFAVTLAGHKWNGKNLQYIFRN